MALNEMMRLKTEEAQLGCGGGVRMMMVRIYLPITFQNYLIMPNNALVKHNNCPGGVIMHNQVGNR